MSKIGYLSDSHAQKFVIDGITIKLNEDVHYCLNDIHNASGDANKHKLNLRVGLDSTQAFMEEVKKAGYPAFNILTSMPGRTGETFAVKELGYAYAMWVSATYHLKVVRA